jgi:predicted ArsR family transcriptional regulator
MSDRPSGVKGTRGRIVDLIRRSPATATEIARELGLTYNAVRGHLTSLERDGLVRSEGVRQGGTRPAALYELAPGIDDVLSRAYTPFAAQLVRTLAETLSEPNLDVIMRDVGRGLASQWPRAQGSLEQRVERASALLQELGAPNEVERTRSSFRIRGFGCLLAAADQGQPHVCHAMETLLGTITSAQVTECCDRGERPRCCFIIEQPDARTG